MKIALISGWDDNCADLAAASWPNKVEYCQIHGYAPVCLKAPHGRGGYWTKFDTLTDQLADYDYALMIDLDTIIMNMAIKVEDFIEEGRDLTMTTDINGVNLGVSLWKNTEWAHKFIAKIQSEIHTNPFAVHEQSLISCYLFSEPKDKWGMVPQRTFNSYCYGFYQHRAPHGYPEGEYQPGDFLIHLPGMSNSQRISFIHENLVKVTRP